MTKLLYFISSFVTYLVYIESAKILGIFPTPSISHQLVFRRLTNELVRRGHDVTVITTDPSYPVGQTPKNLTEIDVHDISYKLLRQELEKVSVGKNNDIYNQIQAIFSAFIKNFKAQIAIKEVDEIIKKKRGQFDLLLLEAIVKPELIYSHLYKVPVIKISSSGGTKKNLKVIGAPMHPLLYPTLFHQRVYNLSNWEKLHQLYKHWWIENYLDEIETESDKMLKTIFGSNVPSLDELSNNVDMYFLNVHPIWTDNQPVPPNVVFIGGIHIPTPKQLPKDLHTLLDSSRNGVIYFSLGTNVNPSLLPPEKIQMFVKVFSQLPYDVVWKWNKDELPGEIPNINIFKWLPQSDLLRHPNVKLFITQGGLQSSDEAINAGVPLIGLPMLADQWYNVEKYVYHKIGVRLDIDSLTEAEFRNAIEIVIGDPSYRENIVRLRNLMMDQPQQPLERAIWWTEYVLRHGGAKHLRAAGANITWAQYLELELVTIVALSFLCALSIFCIIVYLVWKFIKRNLKIISTRLKIKIT